jgi:hypothetical protein
MGQHSFGGDAMTKTSESGPQAGDIIEIHGHQAGQSGRIGKILEVIGEPGHEHFRVCWEDGRESIVYPSSDAIVGPGRKTRRAAT